MSKLRLSYSKMDRYKTCPLSYKLHYLDKFKSEPSDPLIFGKLIHTCLELYVKNAKYGENEILDIFTQQYTKENLTDQSMFEEGRQILISWVTNNPDVHQLNILGIEQEIRMNIAGFDLIGYIDRIDQLDDDTIEIIDYKTNRMIFSREDVDQNLQMSIYTIALKSLYPDKKIVCRFDMLRHGFSMHTQRSEEQLDAAVDYIKSVGNQLKTASTFPAKLNTNCIYCDHRQNCGVFQKALIGKQEFICDDLNDLDSVAKEYQEVSNLAKILYARKATLGGVIKIGLLSKEKLEYHGFKYAMGKTTKVTYPNVNKTVDVLNNLIELDREIIEESITEVKKTKLDAFLKEQKKQWDKAKKLTVEMALKKTADISYSPRLNVRAIK